jgi:hypothetical protein
MGGVYRLSIVINRTFLSLGRGVPSVNAYSGRADAFEHPERAAAKAVLKATS